MNYKLIYEDENIEIWFEPITDKVDGFVVHNKDEHRSIIGIYTPMK